MSETPTPSTAVAVRQPPRVSNIQPLFDTDHFEHFQRAATALMHSTLLRDSIRGPTPQACFSNLMLIFDQADRLGVPATVVAQNVDVVFGQLVYRGVLVAAMIEAKMGKLFRHYTGERGADDYRVYIWDRPFTEENISEAALAALKPGKYPRGARMVDGSVREWRTMQKDQRTPNPAWTGQATQNQLGYRGDREWCRHYEPGLLLGVFSDDEMQAYDDARVVSVTTLEPDRPIISAEMTKPAAEAQGSPPAAASAPASSEPASGAAPAQPTPQPAQAPRKRAAAPNAGAPAAKDAARDARVAEETAARLARCERAALLGFDHGKRQLDRVKGFEVGDVFTDEEARNYSNGYGEGWEESEPAEGSMLEALAEVEPELVSQVIEDHHRAPSAEEKAAAAHGISGEGLDTGRKGLGLDAFEAGHAAGLAGLDGAVPNAWSNFPDDWSEGWNAGAAERLQDAAAEDDGAEEGDEFEELQSDGEADGAGHVFTAFDAFAAQIRTLGSWGEIKHALSALASTEDWKAAVAARNKFPVASARVSAWLRELELEKTGADRVDFTQDLSAFRCWVEFTDDVDLIMAKWGELIASPAFTSLNDAQRSSFEVAIKGRVGELQAAAH